MNETENFGWIKLRAHRHPACMSKFAHNASAFFEVVFPPIFFWVPMVNGTVNISDSEPESLFEILGLIIGKWISGWPVLFAITFGWFGGIWTGFLAWLGLAG